MKKLISLILALCLVLSLAACSGTASQEKQEGAAQSAAASAAEEAQSGAASAAAEAAPMSGSWQRAESPVVSQEQTAVLEKGVETLTGASYEPLAYLASQVVAGTNHRFLCKVTPVAQGATPTYAVVTVYEDLEGSAQVIDVQDYTDMVPEEQQEDSDWTLTSSPELTEEASATMKKAVETMSVGDYVPVALLATQEFDGNSYCILCEQGDVAEGSYVIVHVYEDVDGEADITEVVPFESMEDVD